MSRRIKVIIGVVAVLVVLYAIGASDQQSSKVALAGAATPTATPAANTPASTAPSTAPTIGPTETPTPEPTPAVTPTAAPTDTPAPKPVVLLSLSGSGIKNSKTFNSSGDSVDVVYTFNCSSFGSQGNFIVDFYGASDFGPDFPDGIVNELAKSGSNTTTEYLNGATGPFHVSMNSECKWTVKVIGLR